MNLPPNLPPEDQPQPLTPGELVSPAPFISVIGQAQAPDGAQFISIRIESTNGMFVFLLSPQDATELGKAMMKGARDAMTGLSVIENGTHKFRPPGNGDN